MKSSPIFTIGRQFGSGGHDVGLALASRLGIPFYDGDLIAKTAQDSGLCEEVVRQYEEKTPAGASIPYLPFFRHIGSEQSLGQRIYFAQFEAIRNIAQHGPAVIVGRCADYVLREHDPLVSVFVHASFERRVERIVGRLGLDEEAARKTVQRADKARASYYNFFTDGKWGDAATYDLCLCADRLETAQLVDLIVAFAKATQAWA